MAYSSTYLITFVCYGTWLPGQAGAVERFQNLFGSPLPEEDRSKEARARAAMKQPSYLLDELRRQVVLESLQEVCSHRRWKLLAAHVRSTHVHVVLDADRYPEHVMNSFKAYASRNLNRLGLDGPDCRRWARHGSTRHLWSSEAVTAAVHYVVCEQGERMAVFELGGT